jgi:hypothetical protein
LLTKVIVIALLTIVAKHGILGLCFGSIPGRYPLNGDVQLEQMAFL